MVIYIIITGGNFYDIQQSFKKIVKKYSDTKNLSKIDWILFIQISKNTTKYY